MNLMSNLPVVKGDVFDWSGNDGWTNIRRIGYSFEPGYVGYTDDVGFVVESHRTGVKKLFLYDGSFHDEDGKFAGTKWSADGGLFCIEIEWNP